MQSTEISPDPPSAALRQIFEVLGRDVKSQAGSEQRTGNPPYSS